MAVLRVLAALGEDRELVAGQPADDRFARQDRAQPLADRFEYAVAGVVAERVVDFLEIVDVHVQQHQPAAPAGSCA